MRYKLKVWFAGFLLLQCLVLTFVERSSAQQWVNGYTRRDGTYVQGYHRSTPDGSTWNNYSTRGNVNPYTGQQGTVNPYRQSPSGFGGSNLPGIRPGRLSRYGSSNDD